VCWDGTSRLTCVDRAVVGHAALRRVLPPGARLGAAHGVVVHSRQTDERRPAGSTGRQAGGQHKIHSVKQTVLFVLFQAAFLLLAFLNMPTGAVCGFVL
jgi:hypothetical protein